MTIQTVLLDLDGTLTDPEIGITRCIEYALSRLGAVYNGESLDWCIGPPLLDSFAILLDTQDQVVLQQALGFYRERFAEVGMFENTIYPDVMDGLIRLTQQEFTLYLATSKPHVYATRILEHFKISSFFKGAYGSELSGERTDKTDLIAYILEKEGFDPNHAVMVGDRKHDVIGARNNGIKTLAVTYGYGTQEELSLIHPDQQCRSFNDVVDFILANQYCPL